MNNHHNGNLAHESGKETDEMLRKRMYLDTTRRPPVTESWLVEQDARRREALRDTEWSQCKAFCGALVMWIMAVGVAVSLFAGLGYLAVRWFDFLKGKLL